MTTRVAIDWARCQPRRKVLDGAYLERCRHALAAGGSGATAVLFSGTYPPWLGRDFWLDLDSPELFVEWAASVSVELDESCRTWVPIERANGFTIDRYVRGPGRRSSLATGFAIRCLDNLLAAHTLACEMLHSAHLDNDVRYSHVAFAEYELDRLMVDLLLHRALGVDRPRLHDHLAQNRIDWYAAFPRPTVRDRIDRHFTRSFIPLEQAFPRAQAAIARAGGASLDSLEVHDLERLPPEVADIYRRRAQADPVEVLFRGDRD